jgi:hypothetical protein
MKEEEMTDPKQEKPCETCRYFDAWCKHPKVVTFYAHEARMANRTCGPSGLLWEAREEK